MKINKRHSKREVLSEVDNFLSNNDSLKERTKKNLFKVFSREDFDIRKVNEILLKKGEDITGEELKKSFVGFLRSDFGKISTANKQIEGLDHSLKQEIIQSDYSEEFLMKHEETRNILEKLQETSYFKKNSRLFLYLTISKQFDRYAFNNAILLDDLLGPLSLDILQDGFISEIIKNGKNENIEIIVTLIKKNNKKKDRIFNLLKNKNIVDVISDGDTSSLFYLRKESGYSDQHIIQKIVQDDLAAQNIVDSTLDLSVWQDIVVDSNNSNIKTIKKNSAKFSSWLGSRRKWRYAGNVVAGVATIDIGNIVSKFISDSSHKLQSILELYKNDIVSLGEDVTEQINNNNNIVENVDKIKNAISVQAQDMETSNGTIRDFVTDIIKNETTEKMGIDIKELNKTMENANDNLDNLKDLTENIENIELDINSFMKILQNTLDKTDTVLMFVNVFGIISIAWGLFNLWGMKNEGKINNKFLKRIIITGVSLLILSYVMIHGYLGPEIEEYLNQVFNFVDGE